MNSTLGKFKGYILVRDKEGNPKVDDIYNIPKEIWDYLTDKDRKYIESRRNK